MVGKDRLYDATDRWEEVTCALATVYLRPKTCPTCAGKGILQASDENFVFHLDACIETQNVVE